MTEGTRTLGQRRYENTWQRIQQFGHWLPNEIWAAVQIGKSGYERAEEVGTDVRALAATVAELRGIVDIQMGYIEELQALRDRLAALESPGSAESAPEPVCEYCGGGGKIVHLTFDEVCGHCRLAEQAAQEPEQCPCGAMIDPCDGRCEPPALDPQIEEIITQAYLYGSARCAQGIEVGAGRDSGESIKRMLKEWETLTEMIRAYGGDAREGGK